MKIYIRKLYNKNFPNIIFICPSKTNESNTISCEDSSSGYYSYYCFRRVYHKYPDFKGYLYINDDLFLKVWELDKLNFDIPWLNQFVPLNKRWFHYSNYKHLSILFEKNIKWKLNLIEFIGYFGAIHAMSDVYYLPKYYASKICDLFNTMYKSKVFLEYSIPNSMAILLALKYQIIYIRPLWGKNRNSSINFLYSESSQITVHPIKLSNKTTKTKLIQYKDFINANEY